MGKSRFISKIKGIRAVSAKSDRAAGNMKSSMRSSWIEYYEWVPNTRKGDIGKFYMKVVRGKRYSWDDIPKEQASQAIGGNATCITNDSTGAKRWTVGKSPSLGASYHQICKFFGSATNAADYSSMLGDVAYDKAKDYYKEGKGRPNKKYSQWKRFGWTKHYKKRKTVGA